MGIMYFSESFGIGETGTFRFASVPQSGRRRHNA